MSDPTSDPKDWQARLAALWGALDRLDAAAFRARMQALADERPPGDAVALFELASAHDSTGAEDAAEPLYRQALAAGLPPHLRRQAVIQLASTLRNLGRVSESIALLLAEREQGSDELDDALNAFLALALCDAGDSRSAAGLALGALARHLPRYNISLARYAQALLQD